MLEDNPSEDTVLNKCNAAVQILSKLEENAESSLAQGMSSAMGFIVVCLHFIKILFTNKRKSVLSLLVSLYMHFFNVILLRYFTIVKRILKL